MDLRRSLVGCSPWGREELNTTERLHFHFSLSCIGEGNGNPLQCSCLENPREGRAWWAAIYGVAQSWTRWKRLSSSSSNQLNISPWDVSGTLEASQCQLEVKIASLEFYLGSFLNKYQKGSKYSNRIIGHYETIVIHLAKVTIKDLKGKYRTDHL